LIVLEVTENGIVEKLPLETQKTCIAASLPYKVRSTKKTNATVDNERRREKIQEKLKMTLKICRN